MILNIICFSQTIEKNPKEPHYYIEKLRLNTKEKEFIDTAFSFRDYIENNDEKRIVCNGFIIDEYLDNLIWGCKYIKVYLEYQCKLNKFSIISYKEENNSIIVSYFLCDRKSKETVEMVRFKIVDKEIIGINILPCCYDGFVPIEEFDKPKFTGD